MSRRLLVLVGIQPGEDRLVGLMFAHYLLLGVAYHFTQTAAFAIFLANFDARNLPYTYIINAITITLLVSGYLKLGQRFSLSAMLVVNVSFLLGLTVLFALGVPAGVGWVFFLLPTLFELTVQLGNLEFWTLAGRLFDLRQSKRLFGLIGSGNWLAVIVGGLLTPLLVAWVGTANLLWISVGGLIATVAVLIVITRTFASSLAPANSETATVKRAEKPANLLKSRYALLIFSTVSLFWIIFYFLDNIFFVRTAERFSEEAELASFLGIFFAAFGVVALLVSVVFTGPVIGRFGVRLGARILPITLLIGSLLMVALGLVPGLFLLLFWITAATKLMDMAVGFTLDRTVLNILYQPLPVSQRVRVKTTAEGIFLPLAIGLSGVALLFFNRVLSFDANQLTYVLLLLVIGWVIVAVLIGREYPVMLLQALKRRRISGLDLPLEDASSQAVISEALQNPHPQVALYALNQLAQTSPREFEQVVPIVLKHPAPEVRRETLRWVEQLGLTSQAEVVREQLSVETPVELQAAALQTLAGLEQDAAVEEIYPYLDSSEPALKSAAIVGLLKQGSVEVTMVAEGKLLQLAVSPNPAERILATGIVGQVKARNLAQLLDNLVQDKNAEVCRAALAVAGQAHYNQLWPQVINHLSARKTRGVATTALVAGGTDALMAIQSALAKEDQTRDIQLRLYYLCGRIGGSTTTGFLLNRLTETSDDSLRTEIVTALHRFGYQANSTELTAIQEQLNKETDLARGLLSGLVDLEDTALEQSGIEPAAAWLLLRAALQTRFKDTQGRLLLLLSFMGQRDPVLRARDNLFADQSEKRAYALEIIEVSVSSKLKAQLFPLLEPLSPVERLTRLGASTAPARSTLADRLVELIAGLHPWTSACALFVTPLLPQVPSQLAQSVKACLEHVDPLVTETAAQTANRLNPGQGTTRSV